MKKYIFTLAISMLVLGKANANHQLSDLTVRLHDFHPVIVEFDNYSYNTPTTKFIINDIQPGRHRLMVWAVAENNYYYPNNSPRLMFSGFVDVLPSALINTMITKNHALKVVRVTQKFEEPIVYAPYYPNYTPAPLPIEMSCVNFESLKATIASKSFESTRLNIAKQVISNNLVSTRQVAELMDLMTFETTKLELAKFAYRYTVDPSNYYLTYNQFTFESSIHELSQYIDHHS
ncbi:hypothetical protein BH11BAC2_BH11BAC2_13220 [soil metagenome]